MKKLILIIITFYNLNLYSQHLTMNDLDYLYNNNIEGCDALLTQKGFVYDKTELKDGKLVTLWYYKRHNSNDTNSNKSNEFIYKECEDKTFSPECDLLQYIFSDNLHFNAIKENIKNNKLAIFMYSEPSEKSGLNFYYLYPGPIELRFVSLPTKALNVKTFGIILKKMNVTYEDEKK
jgi:hypothetical protein